MAGTTMAGPKKKAARSLKNKERKGPGFRTIGIRVSDAYAEWLERAAKHDKRTVASHIEKALEDRAIKIEFGEAPPERIP